MQYSQENTCVGLSLVQNIAKFFRAPILKNICKRLRIHVGMDEMYEIVHQATYMFLGINEVYKLVMDEMYEISWFIAKFEYEYSKICVVSVVRA